MKFLLALCLSVGTIPATAQLGIAAPYSDAEIADIVNEVLALQRDIEELRSIDAQIATSSVDAPAAPDLSRKRAEVLARMDMRQYGADEADRRLIEFLEQQIRLEPRHPWAPDWRKRISDAKRRLLRGPGQHPGQVH